MSRLIQKWGYIHAGNAGGYMKYIATREGVEKVSGSGPPTEKQQRLIADLLHDFPDSTELFEYADYCTAPTASSASAFISAALDANAHTLQPGDGYMRYISTRQGVELRAQGTHGLFGQSENIDLQDALSELRSHEGNVWTVIYSLRREDAARLGYDNAAAWRALLLAQQAALAQALKIPPQALRWYAAFHDAGHHPHVHVMLWSADPQKRFLTKQGVADMRSKMTNAIFKDELQQLYQKKDLSYKELATAAQAELQRLLVQMERMTQVEQIGRMEQREQLELPEQLEKSACGNSALAEKMSLLVNKLETVSGKKVYGYLKKPVKELVDSIVDDLAALPQVAACYAAWNRLRDELETYYRQQPRQHLPLSKQKEFKPIRNMVIREADALRMGEISFEDDEAEQIAEKALEQAAESTAEWAAAQAEETQENERPTETDLPFPASSAAPKTPDTRQSTVRHTGNAAIYAQARKYRAAKNALLNEEASPEEKAAAIRSLETLWADGFSVAAHMLGKVWRDGSCGVVNGQAAEYWFRCAASAGLDYSQYALGKLLQAQGRIAEAVGWYQQAAAQNNQYARFRLGKLYLLGDGVPKDIPVALGYLTASAGQGNQFAQYTLGKLYLPGEDVPQDIPAALGYLTSSAEQGNPFARYTLGKLYLAGDSVSQDIPSALKYLTASAKQGNPFAQYTLGKLYLSGEDVPRDIHKALEYLTASAKQGNQFAQYTLGKLYLTGDNVPQDVPSALKYLTASASKGNQFAQYALGKLYLQGRLVRRDRQQAEAWLTLSAAQGNVYAQFFLDHMDQYRDPSPLLAIGKLLWDLSGIFRANSVPPTGPAGIRMDSKRRRKLQQKRLAMGHRLDDHEDQPMQQLPV